MAEFRFPQFIPDPNDPPSVGKKIAAAIPDVLAQPVIKAGQFWNGFMGGQTAIPNTPVYDATVRPAGAPVVPGVTQKIGAAAGDVLSLPLAGLQALGNYIDPVEVSPVKSITPRMDAIRAMPGYNAVADAPVAKAAAAGPAVMAMPTMDMIPGAAVAPMMDVSGAKITNMKTVANLPTLAAASAAAASGEYDGPRRLRQDLSFRQLGALPAVPKAVNAKEQAGAILLQKAVGVLNDPKATLKDRQKAYSEMQGIYATGLPMADLIAEAAAGK